MTRIVKLVMNGFKSFSKHTEIPFDDDFNVVVGPNGSGKSNILDALCFVLGRLSSKGLRTEKFSNLVYNGGKFKKPATKAEVSIVFDNSNKEFPTDEPFVKVTRIVNAKGQSVYKINDEKRTRTQILELLSLAKIDPDGHNIVLQGDIVHFVEMNAEQRREVIEEVSGIGIYEDRKKKALAELGRVEERLKEIEILLAERKTHLRELRKDRDQAMKYKDMSDKIRQYKATYLELRIKTAEKRETDFLKNINEQEGLISKLKSDIEKLKETVNARKEGVSKISHQIEEEGEQEQVELNRVIERLRVDIATTKNRISVIDGEIVKIRQRKDQLESDLGETKDKIASITEDKAKLGTQKKEREDMIARLDEDIATIQQNSNMQDIGEIEQNVDKLEKEAEDKQGEIQKLSERKQELLREKDRQEYQINSIDEQVAKVDVLKEEHKKELEDLAKKKSAFKKLVVELNKELNKDSALAVQLGDVRRELESASAEVVKLRAKELTINERATSNVAVKRILEQKSIKGVIGTVSKLGQVPSDYAMALEVASGARLNSVVVETDKTAQDCIEYLKKSRLGIATFLPLNKVKGKPLERDVAAILHSNGVVGLASNLITYDQKYKNIFTYVLGSTVVVDNLAVTRRIGIGKARMVTLDGDLVETSGAMVGGYRERKARGGFSEAGLTKDIAKLERKESDLQAEVANTESSRLQTEQNITTMKQQKAEIEGEIIKAEKGLHLESGDLDASMKKKEELRGYLAKIEEEYEGINKTLMEHTQVVASLKQKRAELREKISALHNPSVVAELNTLQQKRQELREEAISIDGQIKNSEAQAASIFSPEVIKISQVLKDLDKETERFNKEKVESTATIANKKKELKLQEEKAAKFKDKYRGLFEKRTVIMEEIQKHEEKIIRKEEQTNTIEVRINSISVKKSELGTELTQLREEFAQYSDVELLKQAQEDYLKGQISRYERMVLGMGNVNMKALEVYDGVEKQYNNLVEKKDTLDREHKDVFMLMQEIEGRKKDLFMNTFNAVNENFRTIFASLSTKGEANMVLENEENPFEGGLFVRVRLTGNKFMDMRSLSGGEKSMTALAVIFAIQEYDPASFYIFDEVDAALDKRNSEKLSALIKQYSAHAQYIVISHNDAIVADALTLYGVRMDEHGSSQVVSLKMEQTPQEPEADVKVSTPS